MCDSQDSSQKSVGFALQRRKCLAFWQAFCERRRGWACPPHGRIDHRPGQGKASPYKTYSVAAPSRREPARPLAPRELGEHAPQRDGAPPQADHQVEHVGRLRHDALVGLGLDGERELVGLLADFSPMRAAPAS